MMESAPLRVEDATSRELLSILRIISRAMLVKDGHRILHGDYRMASTEDLHVGSMTLGLTRNLHRS